VALWRQPAAVLVDLIENGFVADLLNGVNFQSL
jgi:hypothetical protein